MSAKKRRYPKLEWEGSSPPTPMRVKRSTKTPNKKHTVPPQQATAVQQQKLKEWLERSARNPPDPKPKTPRKPYTRKAPVRARIKLPSASQIKPKQMVAGSSPVEELNERGERLSIHDNAKARNCPRRIDAMLPIVKHGKISRAIMPKDVEDEGHSRVNKTRHSPTPQPLREPESASGSRVPCSYSPPQSSPPSPPPDQPIPDSNPFVMRRRDAEAVMNHTRIINDITSRCLAARISAALGQHGSAHIHSVGFRTPSASDYRENIHRNGLVISQEQVNRIVLAEDTPDSDAASSGDPDDTENFEIPIFNVELHAD